MSQGRPPDRGFSVEMHQIRCFLAVATHLNFTRAARELRVAQPSLTRAIQKMEEALGGTLFRRERSNTHLTELGRLMLPHLRTVHASAEAASTQARRLRQKEIGALSLGLGAAVPPKTPMALLSAAAHSMTDFDLSIEVADDRSIEQRLLLGEFDAAIVTADDAANPRFDLREIASDPLVVAFAPGHRFAASPSVSLSSLDAEPLVAHTGCWHEAAAAEAMACAGLRHHIRCGSRDGAWVAELVRAGLGCAVVPAGFAAAQMLESRLLDDCPLRCRTVLATVAGRRHSAALSWLIRAAQGQR